MQENLKLITDMNMDTFRFSLAWCRILPSTRPLSIINFTYQEKMIQTSRNCYLYETLECKLITSLVWPLSVEGTIAGGINQAGVDFYNSLIDEVIAKGILLDLTVDCMS